MTIGFARLFTPALCVVAVAVPLSAEAADPAAVPVAALDDGLLSIMKAGGSVASRSAAIGPVVDRAFDLPLMTRLAIGPSWTGIAPADQQALIAAFRRMTIGESFTLDPKVQTRGADRLVRTTLNIPGKTGETLSYRLRQNGGAWKIIDVFYRNAISQIATRRADFAGVLAKGGAKALIAHLDALATKSAG